MTCESCTQLRAELVEARAEIGRLRAEVFAQDQRWHRAILDPDLKDQLAAERAAREKAETERDLLKADQADWRKGVGLISSALGKDTLSCVDLAETALTIRAERDELALLTVPSDDDAQVAVRLRIAEARVAELEAERAEQDAIDAFDSLLREGYDPPEARAILAARSAKGGANV